MLVMYTTYPDEATAKTIVDALLARRLIACTNLHSIQSTYLWEGEIARETEWVALMKTRRELLGQVTESIRAMHPYEVPCITHWEAAANADYEQWVRACTQ